MCNGMCESCRAEMERRLLLEKEIKEVIMRLDKDLPIQEFYSLKNRLRYLTEEMK